MNHMTRDSLQHSPFPTETCYLRRFFVKLGDVETDELLGWHHFHRRRGFPQMIQDALRQRLLMQHFGLLIGDGFHFLVDNLLRFVGRQRAQFGDGQHRLLAAEIILMVRWIFRKIATTTC